MDVYECGSRYGENPFNQFRRTSGSPDGDASMRKLVPCSTVVRCYRIGAGASPRSDGRIQPIIELVILIGSYSITIFSTRETKE